MQRPYFSRCHRPRLQEVHKSGLCSAQSFLLLASFRGTRRSYLWGEKAPAGIPSCKPYTLQRPPDGQDVPTGTIVALESQLLSHGIHRRICFIPQTLSKTKTIIGDFIGLWGMWGTPYCCSIKLTWCQTNTLDLCL